MPHANEASSVDVMREWSMVLASSVNTQEHRNQRVIHRVCHVDSVGVAKSRIGFQSTLG